MRKKNWQNALYICLMLAAVFLLFRWYSTANSRRIEEQNLTYAMDSAGQTAQRIGSEFGNALLRVRNYAYLLGAGESRPRINADLLKQMEAHSAFDAIRFTNADGLNLASDGQTNDSRDRNYFTSGMRGESGLEVVRSRLTGQMMAVFYAPIEYDGEIIGMLLGLYFAEDYLREMLTTSYFGEPAVAYLCTRDTAVIAGSEAVDHSLPLLDQLRGSGAIDGETGEKSRRPSAGRRTRALSARRAAGRTTCAYSTSPAATTFWSRPSPRA